MHIDNKAIDDYDLDVLSETFCKLSKITATAINWTVKYSWEKDKFNGFVDRIQKNHLFYLILKREFNESETLRFINNVGFFDEFASFLKLAFIYEIVVYNPSCLMINTSVLLIISWYFYECAHNFTFENNQFTKSRKHFTVHAMHVNTVYYSNGNERDLCSNSIVLGSKQCNYVLIIPACELFRMNSSRRYFLKFSTAVKQNHHFMNKYSIEPPLAARAF